MFAAGVGEVAVDRGAAHAQGCGDRLLETPEPDPAVSQPSDGVDQMPQRPAEPIQLPHDQSVAGPQLVQQLLENWPVRAGAAGRLGEHPVAAGTLASTWRWGCWSVVETRA